MRGSSISKVVIGLLLLGLLIAGTATTGWAKMGFGIKAPMEIFVAFGLTPRLMLEAGVIGPLIGPVTGIAVRVNLKLFLRPLKLLDYPVMPFLGGGMAFASMLHLGNITGFQALTGLELALRDTPVSIFGELEYQFINISHLGLGFFVPTVGVRFDF